MAVLIWSTVEGEGLDKDRREETLLSFASLLRRLSRQRLALQPQNCLVARVHRENLVAREQPVLLGHVGQA